MTKFDNICYKNNFIKKVIVRINFQQFIPNESLYCNEVENKILSYFPRKGKLEIVKINSIDVIVDAANKEFNTNGNFIDGLQKKYVSRNEKNKVILSNTLLAFEVGEYQSFKEIYEWVQEILTVFFQKNKIGVSRIGLRYINLYDKVQKNYFSPEISAILSTKCKNKDIDLYLTRAMNLIEFRVDSMNLDFRYGLYNPNYPNMLEKNNFALDYDCYINEYVDSLPNILGYIQKGHDAIQGLFEESISDVMRKEMQCG